jgi:predicted N-acetyltransferase YhbS
MKHELAVEHFRPAEAPTELILASALLANSLLWESASEGEFLDNSLRLARCHLVVAHTEKVVLGIGAAGIASLDESAAILNELAVDCEHQRQGIGSLVLSTIEQVLKEEGVETITCVPLGESIRFYKKHGYASVAGYEDEFTKEI